MGTQGAPNNMGKNVTRPGLVHKSVLRSRIGISACASTGDIAALDNKEEAAKKYADLVAPRAQPLEEGTSNSDLSISTGSSPNSPFAPPKIKPSMSMSDLHVAAIKANVTQKDVVLVFGDTLKQMAYNSKTKRLPGEAISLFQGQNVPKVDIGHYIWRIVYYLNKFPAKEPTFFAGSEDMSLSESENAKEPFKENDVMSRGLRCLLLALVYIDRISQRHTDFVVTPFTLHRIVLTAMLVAIKFTDDHPIGVDVFARLGGVKRKDVRRMELKFCSLIGFDFNISEPEFDEICMKQLHLAFQVARKKGGSFINKENTAKST